MAKNFVVECGEVPKFSRKPRFSVVQFSVDNDANAQPPAYIDKDYLFFSFHNSLHIFAIGHCPGVVVNPYLKIEFFGEDFGNGLFAEIKTAVTVSRFGIYTSRNIQVDTVDFFFEFARLIKEVLNMIAQRVECFGCVLIDKGDTHLTLYDIAFKIHQRNIQMMSGHVYPHKIDGSGI